MSFLSHSAQRWKQNCGSSKTTWSDWLCFCRWWCLKWKTAIGQGESSFPPVLCALGQQTELLLFTSPGYLSHLFTPPASAEQWSCHLQETQSEKHSAPTVTPQTIYQQFHENCSWLQRHDCPLVSQCSWLVITVMGISEPRSWSVNLDYVE